MENKKEIRVRFAPSPTGHLHLGSVRVAIFNWLFARHNNGAYVLRIEDTDLERSKQEYTDSIFDALEWCGIDHDEVPVIQSSRLENHKKIVQTLLEEKKAYRCYCTPEEIIERQKAKDGYDDLYSMYDGKCRDYQSTDEDANKPFVVRFAVPREKKIIAFTDLVRGDIKFDIDQFDDFIIARSDGSPMYNLVVVVDDAHMRISHVIRGEDHISNTPKQIMLYQACGLVIPEFAHLPLILGPSGDRLSKRDAATSVLDYKKQGILPDALFNYLVRLGWSHGDQEIFTKDELISFFSFEHVGKKGSIFDTTKLAWLNGVYIRDMQAVDIFDYLVNNIDSDIVTKLKNWNDETILQLVDLYKDRVKTVVELANILIVLHDGPQSFDQEAVKKWITPSTNEHLVQLIEILESLELFAGPEISVALKMLCKELGIKLVALAQPIRIALTGTSASPGIFSLLSIIGKRLTIERLKALLQS